MNAASSRPLLVYTATIFASATLLFLVQPMVAKMILPKFGGTPAVWSTCMVFFQAALLAGYAYAHCLSTYLSVRRQVLVHMGVLALPLLAFLLFPLHARYQQVEFDGEGNPAFYVLFILAQLIGVPFLLVSTSAPLLQRWFSHTGHASAKDPYFLYAASNLGSMLSLFLYPAVLEPTMPLAWQGAFWMAGYGVLAALTVACGLLVVSVQGLDEALPAAVEPHLDSERAPSDSAQNPPGWVQQLQWIGLAFVPSSLMIGVTTYMTMDIAAIPLLWLPPLVLYLLSFILVFSKTTAPVHPLMVLLLPVAVLLVTFLNITYTHLPRIELQFALHLGVLFVVAMVCHGELAQRRPAPQYLTGFYLCMSLGGVLGGLFNALIAPNLFYTVAEYPLVLTLACLCLPALTAEAKEANRLLELVMLVLFGLFGLLAAYQHFHDWRAGGVALVPTPWRPWPGLNAGPLHGVVAALVATALLAYLVLGQRTDWLTRALDVVLPLLLGLLAARFLFFPLLRGRLGEQVELLYPQDPARLRSIITCTLLVVLAYGLSVRPVRLALGVAVLLLASAWKDVPTNIVQQERSFFCVYRVEASFAPMSYDRGHYNKLVHGTTMHGMQRLPSDPDSVGATLGCLAGTTPLAAGVNAIVWREILHDRRNEPLTYFHKTGPVGQLIEALVQTPNDRRPLAVLGLGTGTLAGYVLPGQDVIFYEIDPLAIRIAKDPKCFSYLKECRGNVEVILGAGRLKLKKAADGRFRLLFMDAFSSDSIPVHLMTREAIQLYFEKLTPDGVLVVNVSNRYLLPAPVLANIAASLGYVALQKGDYSESIPGKASSDWVVLARKWEHLGVLRNGAERAYQESQVNALLGLLRLDLCLPLLTLRYEGWEPLKPDASKPLWTDDFSNLLGILR